MANPYQINRVSSEDDSELFSYNERSYNSWQYGDEASLYSIAEDSREDRASEVPSMAGTETASSANHAGVAVEMNWVEASGESEGTSGSDSFYCYQHSAQHNSRRKYLVFACVVGIFMIAIVSAVAVSLNKKDEVPRSNVGEGVHSDDDRTVPTNPSPVPPPPLPETNPSPQTPPFIPQLSPPTASPSTAAPSTPFPTNAPTHSGEYMLADGFVFSALRKCAPTNKLENPSTLEGKVYEKIVLELRHLLFTSEDGFVNYPLHFGVDYIKEKYALEMLYEATNGDQWTDNTGWMVESDPCSGWHGIVNCRTRREGSCGVVHINLSE